MSSETFVVFEGIEGSGKSTQIRLLKEFLVSEGYEVVATHEPGGTPIGEAVRDILLKPEFKEMSPRAEALLYLASRAQHVSQTIRPSLKNKKVVLSDRFSLSSLAYQGYGRNLDLTDLGDMNDWATEGLRPTVTFILLLPTQDGLERATRHRIDRIESEGADFHERVRAGYAALAKSSPHTHHIIDASLDREEIHKEIRTVVLSLLERA